MLRGGESLPNGTRVEAATEHWGRGLPGARVHVRALIIRSMVDVPISTDGIPDFCRRWQIREFALFGSVLRPDFGPRSDVDVLITFEPGAEWSLLDMGQMRVELGEMFGREVDVLEESAIRNPYMLASVQGAKRVVYAA